MGGIQGIDVAKDETYRLPNPNTIPRGSTLSSSSLLSPSYRSGTNFSGLGYVSGSCSIPLHHTNEPPLEFASYEDAWTYHMLTMTIDPLGMTYPLYMSSFAVAWGIPRGAGEVHLR